MAKLYASEARPGGRRATPCASLGAARPARRRGTVERLYRDTPLMIIGEGTNEIQRTIIARQPPRALRRAARRAHVARGRARGAPADRPRRAPARGQGDRARPPHEHERAGRYPGGARGASSPSSGVFGALVPARAGRPRPRPRHRRHDRRGAGARLGDARAPCSPATSRRRDAIGALRRRAGARERLLPADDARRAAGRRRRSARRVAARAATATAGSLAGRAGRSSTAGARGRLRRARRATDGGAGCLLVERGAAGLARRAPAADTLGARGLGAGRRRLRRRAGLGAAARLGDGGGAARARRRALGARRDRGRAWPRPPSRRRSATPSSASTFGKPICQHQAIQLKLADMATAHHRRAAAHLPRAAERLDADAGDDARRGDGHGSRPPRRRPTVTLEAMRIHGGYGYTSRVPGRALLPRRRRACW